MDKVREPQPEQILGEHYIAVASLLAGSNEAEIRAGVNAATTYIERNLPGIVRNPYAAKEIEQMLAQSAQGIPGVERVLSALRSQLSQESQPKEGIDDSLTDPEKPQMDTGESDENEILKRAEHLMDILDIYLGDIQRGNRGSIFQAQKKLPDWQREIDQWPKSVSNNPAVRVTRSKLLGIENALASLDSQ